MKSRLRRAVDGLLQLQDTPHRIALAFGIGIWIAFSPLLGLHTVMALGAAFFFRLSRAAVLLGAYVNNPWTIAPLYLAGTALGCALLGVSTVGLETIEWDRHGPTFYRDLLAHLRPYLWPYVVGNTILGVVGGVAGYFALRAFLERRRRGVPSQAAP
jgi:uncharacterized protein (DUF2062 family)